jgi:N-acetylmuramoyl-L-alanine amidase
LAFCASFNLYAQDTKKTFTLVIDAGHGGHDPGAIGKFAKEKIINLNVALSFGNMVKSNCPDVKVIYTRDKDVFIPLQERANIANRNKADLFVSIHTNAAPKGNLAHGTETYTLGTARAQENLAVAMRENEVITLEKDYKETYEGFDNSIESYIIFELMQGNYMKESVELA